MIKKEYPKTKNEEQSFYLQRTSEVFFLYNVPCVNLEKAGNNNCIKMMATTIEVQPKNAPAQALKRVKTTTYFLPALWKRVPVRSLLCSSSEK